jgi:hypothetical protein
MVSASDNLRAFIVCEVPEKQASMGRVNVPLERLQTWKSSRLNLATVIAKLLDIEFDAKEAEFKNALKIGMLPSKKGRRWVSLNYSPFALEINKHAVPINELLFFVNSSLSIDRERIEDLLERPVLDSEKAYTPSIERQEQRKSETQAMYQDWQDAYEKLRKKSTNKPKSWFAMQIAKLDIAQGRDSETIRKHLK